MKALYIFALMAVGTVAGATTVTTDLSTVYSPLTIATARVVKITAEVDF
jgi:Flp pilus assembly pilin Flp